jgi:integral membrane protein
MASPTVIDTLFPLTENLNPKQKNMWRWLVIIGTIEALSFLLLLFIAVPLKYLGGNHTLVKTLGPIHGTFFLLYVAMVIWAARSFRWRAGRVWLALLASVIPCGPFIFDAWGQ